jgi:predicted nucleotidyltransferase
MSTQQLIPVDQETLSEFCLQWKITKLELAGSFPAPGSEVTLVATFAPDARWSLLDHAHMEDNMGEIMDRKVDLVSRDVLENMQNALSRSAILASIDKRPLYGPG